MSVGAHRTSMLVVDDEPSIPRAVVDTLGPRYAVQTAASTEEGFVLDVGEDGGIRTW